jgi:hypothetical protein
MNKSIAKALMQWIPMFILDTLLLITGLFVVAIAIPFRVKDKSVTTGEDIVNLPKWAWLWGNDVEGLLGTSLKTWKDQTPFKLPVDHPVSMWAWAAVRNPSNNARLIPYFSCPVAKCKFQYYGQEEVVDSLGFDGWQFVIGDDGKRKYYGFYLVRPWSATRSLVIRLGFKIKPFHKGIPKGVTFKVNLFKNVA